MMHGETTMNEQKQETAIPEQDFDQQLADLVAHYHEMGFDHHAEMVAAMAKLRADHGRVLEPLPHLIFGKKPVDEPSEKIK
jgi:hypothetical protein